MKEIKPDKGFLKDHDRFFDTMKLGRGYATCCCGYELIKESEDTYRCTGGNHRYHVSQGEVVFDKYGGILLKKPENGDKSDKVA